MLYCNYRDTEVVKMANAADKTAVVTENLRDMGLDDETTAECLMLIGEKRYAELEKLLKALSAVTSRQRSQV